MRYNPSESAEKVLTAKEIAPPTPPEVPPTWWEKYGKKLVAGVAIVGLGVGIPAILIRRKRK